MRVVIKRDKSGNGEEISINGKPLGSSENIQSDTIIQSFTFTGEDLKELMGQHPDLEGMGFNTDLLKKFKNDKGRAIAFLGVLTEKASEGARVVEITKESAAAKAGLQKDDIITQVGEEVITGPADLAEVIASKKPKELVKLHYSRKGKKATLKAILGEKTTGETKVITLKGSPKMGKGFSIPDMQGKPGEEMVIIENIEEGRAPIMPGMTYRLPKNESASPSLPHQPRLGLKIQDTEEGGSVRVIEVAQGSAAEKAGIKKNDLITAIGGAKIDNTDEARQQLHITPSKTGYGIKVLRGGKEMNFEIKYPKKIKTIDL